MTTIFYLDEGNYYQVYGVTTMIVVLLLLWYFVRDHMHVDHSERSDYRRTSRPRSKTLRRLSKLDPDFGLEGFDTEPTPAQPRPDQVLSDRRGVEAFSAEVQAHEQNIERMPYGLYGDTPTYLYSDAFGRGKIEQPPGSIAVQNSKMYWLKSNTAAERVAWVTGDETRHW